MKTTVKHPQKKTDGNQITTGWLIYKIVKTEDKTVADLKTPFRYDYVGSFT